MDEENFIVSDEAEDTEASEEDVSVQFVGSFEDSFFSYPRPRNPESSYLSYSDVSSSVAQTIRHSDFISLVTAISETYSHSEYFDMRKLDGFEWESIDAGSVFQASLSALNFHVVSPVHNQTETVVNSIVIKRVKRWSMSNTNVSSFNRELRILHHLQGSSKIVSLRGVGWFYNWDTISHIPEPVLMLEPAQHTLQHLVSPDINLSPKTMLSIFYDISKGISELHKCGIVHGDVKPENVLLFNDTRREEGVDVGTYVAKLSDFSLAVLDNGEKQYLPGGTLRYKAPESDEALDFSGLKLTDVYSLGVLFAVVASGTPDVLSLDAIELLESNGGMLPNIADQIIRQSENDTQGSAMAPIYVGRFSCLLRCTLRHNPTRRDLPGLLHVLDATFGEQEQQQHQPQHHRRAHKIEDKLYDPSAADVQIGYGKFSVLSGHIRSHITNGLLEIEMSGEADPRYAQACFELAVIYISGYSDPTAKASEGLQYLWKSAEKGDMRARTVFGRLQNAYRTFSHSPWEDKRLGWLLSAAQKGYVIAQKDLALINPEKAEGALREYATESIRTLFSQQMCGTGSAQPLESSSVLTLDDNSSVELRLHLFAAQNLNESLQLLLDKHQDVQIINLQNPAGDTPLLTACRFGQFETAFGLLTRPDGAVNASIPNKCGENPLHFLWRFDEDQAGHLLDYLLSAGANPDQEAFPSERGVEWDLVPHLPGTPIERLALYNRLDLVKLLLNRGCAIVPSNGNLLRRMLLLAIRLQHVEMQKFLIYYATNCNDQNLRPELKPLHKTRWEYKGRPRSYPEATVLGWVRHMGDMATAGIDVPLSFWQACYHGQGWRTAMESTIESVFSLDPRLEMSEDLLDQTIQFSIQERSYEAFEYLIHRKILYTDGVRGRITDLRWAGWLVASRCAAMNDGDGGSSTAVASERKFLELPILSVNYIDQIYHEDARTLAQQALRRGDRRLFHIMVKHYGANLALPVHDPSSYGNQWNCYSELAKSDHQDMWFVDEFHALNIGYECPYEAHAHPDNWKWQHPLLDAICSRSWALAKKLLSCGAAFLDNMDSETTVLDLILSRENLLRNFFDFIFPNNSLDLSDIRWAPGSQETDHGGYQNFRGIYKAMGFLEENTNRQDRERLATIWMLLLEKYPNVENFHHPVQTHPSVVSMTLELYKWHFRYATPAISFYVFIAPSVHVKIDISSIRKRLCIRMARGVETPRIQSPVGLVRSLIRGSPFDDIPLTQWLSSCLWLYGYLPSIWHPGIHIRYITSMRRDVMLRLACGGLIISVVSFIVWLMMNTYSLFNAHTAWWVRFDLWLFLGLFLFFGMPCWLVPLLYVLTGDASCLGF